MGIYSTLPQDLKEVDVIIVGGGTAGCVIAARLADAGPHLSILVIERGSDNQNLPQTVYPALFKGNFTPDSRTVQMHLARAEAQLASRTDHRLVTGRVLGGGSSVNGLIYTRAQRDDYDSWNTDGWSTDDLLPFLRKFETYHGTGAKTTHGDRGPINVSYGTYRGNAIAKDFIAAAGKVGYEEVEDLQDLATANAASHALRYVSPETGRRQDTASTYLHPRLQSGNCPNLHVLVESEVARIISEKGIVTGVEFRPNPQFRTAAKADSVSFIGSKKLVILSAGTHHTPSLLERSGVGSPEILQNAGIEVLLSLPGVGNGCQDHQMTNYIYKSSLPAEDTIESLIDGTRDVPSMLANNDKFLSWNGIDASAKIRPTSEDLKSLDSSLCQAWNKDFKDVPGKPLAMMFLASGILADPRPFLPGQFFTIPCYLTYPYSRGHVHITGPGLDDPVDIVTGYLGDNADVDLKTHVWLYKKQREVARRMKTYRGETHDHPAFAHDSDAASTGSNARSTEDHIKDIRYSKKDDEAIEKWIREKVGTAYHSIGTCKMAPVEDMGVVDKCLSVHGMTKLKIADLSIVPKNVSGNTMSTALLIGEKAADIFIKELGLASG